MGGAGLELTRTKGGNKEISGREDHSDRDSHSKVNDGLKIYRFVDSSKRELWGGGTHQRESGGKPVGKKQA